MGESTHLNNIMEKHNRITNLQIVFLDIEKYSKRRTQSQIVVIDALTNCIKEALAAVSKKHIVYAQTNSLNFNTDIIVLPTGDGVATAFTFEGLHDIHLDFSLSVLENAYKLRTSGKCEKFEMEGWCNCHPFFNLRVGISEGKGIVFRDTNGQYNVAGGVVNMAARVMNIADRNQIMFTEEAYNQLVDMVDDPHFVDLFKQFNDIQVKHDMTANVYQFADKSHLFLNADPPEDLMLRKRMDAAMNKMIAAYSALPDMGQLLKGKEKKQLVEFSEKLVESFSMLPLVLKSPHVIETELFQKLPDHAIKTDEKD